ncbi:MAG: ABC transporter substrate-binding protein [Bacillota bacterium]
MYKYKKPILLLIIIIFIFLLNSCSIGKKEKPLLPVRVSTISHSVLYAPLYLADALGFFKEEGLEVRVLSINNNGTLIHSLYSNESEIVIAGPQNTINRSDAAKEGLLNVAQLVQKDPSCLMAREPLPDFQWENLNKKIIIGASQNSTPQLMLEYILKKNQLEPYKKVDLIYNIPQETVIGAFQGGVGNFIHLLEPDASVSLGKGMFLTAALADEIDDISYSTIIVKDSFLKTNPHIVQSFINAIYKSQIWFKYHRENEIATKLKPYFPDLEQDTLKKVVSRFKQQNIWTDTPIVSEKGFDKLQDVIISSGMRSQKLPFESLTDNTFALKAQEMIPIPEEYTAEKKTTWQRIWNRLRD